MYIGRIGMPAADGVRYEAVFNQPASVRSRATLT
jgi:hypothetical protein